MTIGIPYGFRSNGLKEAGSRLQAGKNRKRRKAGVRAHFMVFQRYLFPGQGLLSSIPGI